MSVTLSQDITFPCRKAINWALNITVTEWTLVVMKGNTSLFSAWLCWKAFCLYTQVSDWNPDSVQTVSMWAIQVLGANTEAGVPGGPGYASGSWSGDGWWRWPQVRFYQGEGRAPSIGNRGTRSWDPLMLLFLDLGIGYRCSSGQRIEKHLNLSIK